MLVLLEHFDAEIKTSTNAADIQWREPTRALITLCSTNKHVAHLMATANSFETASSNSKHLKAPQLLYRISSSTYAQLHCSIAVGVAR